MTAPSFTAEFESRRALLFTVAYEMLGSVVEAEDVVQDTWLQWAEVDHSQVRDARAFMLRIVSRQALNRLRTLTRRRETYVGEWLPEPLLTAPDVAEEVELAENVSIAMLRVLETLGPAERVVFVLREVFALPYDEIASAIDKKPATVRQIAHRARSHVQARSPRVRVSPAEHAEVAERLLVAIRTGDIDALLRVLSPDVVSVGDGGGLAHAAPRPIRGADPVARFLAVFARTEGIFVSSRWIHGALAVVIEHDGAIHAVISVEVDAGQVTALYGVNNPDKLAGIGKERPLTQA